MIWTTETHQFSVTLCRRTGKPCPALSALALNLARAMQKAEPVTGQDFEIDGECELAACAEGCQAFYSASHSRIRIFCGVGETADFSWFDRLADALMEPGGQIIVNDKRPLPCAMAEARRVLPVQVGTNLVSAEERRAFN